MKRVYYEEFQGVVVYVTGANSGIGLSQANVFLEQGANVFAMDIQANHLKELKQKWPNFDYMIGDVTNIEALQSGVAHCEKVFGPIQILLNTAGKLDSYLPLLETTETLWDVIYETNVKSYFRLTKLILPSMVEKGHGVIINMASIAGLIGGGGGAAYTMSKHAIVGFTKQLALDYADKGIQVLGIAPGAIETPMNAADFSGEGEMAKWVASETPMKRWAQSEEVAHITLFLASKQANYMQGAIVPVDGGWLLK